MHKLEYNDYVKSRGGKDMWMDQIADQSNREQLLTM